MKVNRIGPLALFLQTPCSWIERFCVLVAQPFAAGATALTGRGLSSNVMRSVQEQEIEVRAFSFVPVSACSLIALQRRVGRQVLWARGKVPLPRE